MKAEPDEEGGFPRWYVGVVAADMVWTNAVRKKLCMWKGRLGRDVTAAASFCPSVDVDIVKTLPADRGEHVLWFA